MHWQGVVGGGGLCHALGRSGGAVILFDTIASHRTAGCIDVVVVVDPLPQFVLVIDINNIQFGVLGARVPAVEGVHKRTRRHKSLRLACCSVCLCCGLWCSLSALASKVQ